MSENKASDNSASLPGYNTTDGTPPPLKPFAQSASAVQPSAPSQPRSAFHPDVPAHQKTAAIPNAPSRAVSGMPGNYTASNDSQADFSIDPKQLVIGSAVCLTGGTISACDHLILNGTLEDTSLMDSSHLNITDVGFFKGSAVVENAEIAGKFEGDLTVRGRLTLHAGGSISGSVKYGSIIIEPGGTIKGDMQTISDD